MHIDQLDNHLKINLAPIYLISGDEILLVQESVEKIKHASYQKGFCDRKIYQAETGFDWTQLMESANSFSLFSEKTLIELRIPSGKITETGKKFLIEYSENPPKDKILLISAGKLSPSVKAGKWVKAIEKKGEFIPVWSITKKQLPYWIRQRLQKNNMHIDSDAVNFIVESVEGNLLVANQEIEKLRLLYGEKKLSLDDIISATGNNAR